MDTTATGTDAVQSMEQLCSVWSSIVMDRGTGEIADLPGMAVRWAESDLMFLNALTLTETGLDERQARDRLGAAALFMRSKQKAGLLWLFEELLDPATRACLPRLMEDAGLKVALSGVGMAGDVLPIIEPDGSGLTFVRIRSEDDLKACADLNAQAYGLPSEPFRQGYSGSSLWTASAHAYLGLKDGEPVTTATTVEADGCLYVIMVATAPDHQRQGFGEAVTRKALYEGARGTGLRRATLHSTLIASPVYERIGLRKVANMTFCVPVD